MILTLFHQLPFQLICTIIMNSFTCHIKISQGFQSVIQRNLTIPALTTLITIILHFVLDSRPILPTKYTYYAYNFSSFTFLPF